MKLMIIKNSGSAVSLLEVTGKIFGTERYEDCSSAAALKILNREHPVFVSLKLKEPVNGDNDMMAMLSSIDVNTRLRVSIFNTEYIKEFFSSFFGRIRTFILPGRNTQNLDTP